MRLLGLLTLKRVPKIKELNMPNTPIYDIQIKDLKGNQINLSDFKSKKLMIVNVASKCGFTPQYLGLEELYEEYKDQLNIIGVPCNQFGMQEPGSNEEIANFCSVNYGVTFPITEKVDVDGNNQHPLYAWLTSKAQNGSSDSKVKWNFQKYLISENGELEAVFASNTEPMSEEIINHLSGK